MSSKIILASSSQIRAQLLRDAGLEIEVSAARVDEQTVKASLLQEQASCRDVADALAEMKARKVSLKLPDRLAIGCDQVLEFQGQLFDKPETEQEARDHLAQFSGNTHKLLSACVIYENGKPVWRHVSIARMHMHELSDPYIRDYVDRNWEEIRHCVGCYQLEKEGARLFHKIEGNNFTVLGLPLLELLSYLVLRGTLTR